MSIVRTPFYIEALDAAGKEATGYLGTIGAGLTLGPELIVNGGMEAGDPPTGWDAVANPETFERSGVQKRSGSYSLHLVDSIPSFGQARQYFPLNARTAGSLYRFLFSHHTITGPLNAIFADGGGLALGDVGYADLNAWFDRTSFYIMTVTDNTLGFVTFYHALGGALEFYLDDVSVVKITDPPATAVHIVSAVNGTTRNWASIEAGFDPNNIASWKIYDLAHEGFYLPSDGSTFNRGDFVNGNAFFWSSIDLSPYAGTETEDVSLRQRIISAIDTRFQSILIAAGYKTDLGQHVFAWKETPLAASDIDGLVYRDRTESRSPGCGIYDLILPVELELFSSSPEGIRKCLADIEKAIFVDETWGDLAYDTEIDSSDMVIEQKENIYGASKIIMTVEYRTIRGDPDTAA